MEASVIGFVQGFSKKDGANKGRSYYRLFVTYDEKGITGKACREVFVWSDLCEFTSLTVGQTVNLILGFNGSIKSVE